MFECLFSFRYSCFVLDCSALVHNIKSFKEKEVNLFCFFLDPCPLKDPSLLQESHTAHTKPPVQKHTHICQEDCQKSSDMSRKSH